MGSLARFLPNSFRLCCLRSVNLIVWLWSCSWRAFLQLSGLPCGPWVSPWTGRVICGLIYPSSILSAPTGPADIDAVSVYPTNQPERERERVQVQQDRLCWPWVPCPHGHWSLRLSVDWPGVLRSDPSFPGFSPGYQIQTLVLHWPQFSPRIGVHDIEHGCGLQAGTGPDSRDWAPVLCGLVG